VSDSLPPYPLTIQSRSGKIAIAIQVNLGRRTIMDEWQNRKTSSGVLPYGNYSCGPIRLLRRFAPRNDRRGFFQQAPSSGVLPYGNCAGMTKRSWIPASAGTTKGKCRVVLLPFITGEFRTRPTGIKRKRRVTPPINRGLRPCGT
jgi:hypothetical protein